VGQVTMRLGSCNRRLMVAGSAALAALTLAAAGPAQLLPVEASSVAPVVTVVADDAYTQGYRVGYRQGVADALADARNECRGRSHLDFGEQAQTRYDLGYQNGYSVGYSNEFDTYCSGR
jgi:hypothetical protein